MKVSRLSFHSTFRTLSSILLLPFVGSQPLTFQTFQPRRNRQVQCYPLVLQPFRAIKPGMQRTITSKRLVVYALHSKKTEHDDRDDNDGITTLIASLTSTLSRPIPLVDPPLAWGYPIVLVASLGILPLTTSLLFIGLFILFSWLGRAVVSSDDFVDDDDVDEDNLRPPTDLLALGASIVTSGILAPFGSSNSIVLNPSLENSPGVMVASVGGLLLLSLGFFSWTSIGKVQQQSDPRSTDEPSLFDDPIISNERQWMDLWDRSLEEQESSKSDKSDKRQ